MQDRKIWKAICRAIECQKASQGVRRDRTWQAISEVIPHLPNSFPHNLPDLLDKPVSIENAQEVEQLLQRAYTLQCSRDAQERIKNWKVKMRATEQDCSSWIKKRHQPQVLQVAATDEGGAANCQRRMKAIRRIKMVSLLCASLCENLVQLFSVVLSIYQKFKQKTSSTRF